MRYKNIFFSIFILSFIFSYKNLIYAKTKNFQNLEVSPVTQILNLNKGENYKSFITIINKTNSIEHIVIGVSGFRQYKKTNSPKFSKTINKNSISMHWFSIQNEVTLNPYQKKKIPYTLSVPKNASAGGHFASIVINEKDKKSQIIESIRPLFFINVQGKIQLTGFVKRFTTDKLFNYSGNIKFNTFFENTGNIEFAPFGFIIIKNIFGQVVGVVNVNKEKSLDLPKSIRQYKSNFRDNSFFDTGVYSAQLILNYGNTARVYNINKNITFYIINPIFILLLIIILISIIIYILYKTKKV